MDDEPPNRPLSVDLRVRPLFSHCLPLKKRAARGAPVHSPATKNRVGGGGVCSLLIERESPALADGGLG